MLNDTATPANAAPAPAPVPQPRLAAPFPKRMPRAATHWCDMCGEDQGFLIPGHDSLYECVACATERMRNDLAREQLVEALSPVIGMWVAHWRRAGTPLAELDEIVQTCSGANMARDYEDKYRLTHLRRLGMVYREATLTAEPDPARVMVNPVELPMIARLHIDTTAPKPLRERPYFFDDQQNQVMVLAGIDAVIVPLGAGVRAVIYPDSQVTPTYRVPGFRCPEHLWTSVAAELKYLPEETA